MKAKTIAFAAVLAMALVLSGCTFKAEVNAKDANAPVPDENNEPAEEGPVRLAVIGTPSPELKALLESDSAKALQMSYTEFSPGNVVQGSLDNYNEVLLLEEKVTRSTTKEIERQQARGKSFIIVKGAAYLDSDSRVVWDVLKGFWPVQNAQGVKSEKPPRSVSIESRELKKNRESPIFSGFTAQEMDWELTEVNAHGLEAVEEGTVYDDEDVGRPAIVYRITTGVPRTRSVYFAYAPEKTPVILFNALDYLR